MFGVSPNTIKCKTDSIGTLKGGNMALCDMKYINLTKKLKILGLHFSYNKKLEHEINFQSDIIKIENVLMLWRMRNIMIQG